MDDLELIKYAKQHKPLDEVAAYLGWIPDKNKNRSSYAVTRTDIKANPQYVEMVRLSDINGTKIEDGRIIIKFNYKKNEYRFFTRGKPFANGVTSGSIVDLLTYDFLSTYNEDENVKRFVLKELARIVDITISDTAALKEYIKKEANNPKQIQSKELIIHDSLTHPAHLVERGLSLKTIYNPLFVGTICNATIKIKNDQTRKTKDIFTTVYLLKDENGKPISACQKNTSPDGKDFSGVVAGYNRNGVWQSNKLTDEIKSIYICEQPNNFMSYFQLNEQYEHLDFNSCLALSPMGNYSEQQKVTMQNIIAEYPNANVYLMNDNDNSGILYDLKEAVFIFNKLYNTSVEANVSVNPNNNKTAINFSYPDDDKAKNIIDPKFSDFIKHLKKSNLINSVSESNIQYEGEEFKRKSISLLVNTPDPNSSSLLNILMNIIEDLFNQAFRHGIFHNNISSVKPPPKFSDFNDVLKDQLGITKRPPTLKKDEKNIQYYEKFEQYWKTPEQKEKDFEAAMTSFQTTLSAANNIDDKIDMTNDFKEFIGSEKELMNEKEATKMDEINDEVSNEKEKRKGMSI